MNHGTFASLCPGAGSVLSGSGANLAVPAPGWESAVQNRARYVRPYGSQRRDTARGDGSI